MRQILENLLLALILFLAPAHFFFGLSESAAFVNGLRVDYLIPKLFAVDIAIVLFLLIKATHIKPIEALKRLGRGYKKHLILHSLALLLGLGILANTVVLSPVGGGWYAAELVLLLLFMISLFYQRRSQNSWQLAAFAAAAAFQAGIGIAQFIRQQSVFGYQLLGEPNLSQLIGFSKVVIQGRELVLPYGTTPHPNILGGFLAIYVIGMWSLLLRRPKAGKLAKFLVAIVSIFSIIGLILTFSASAWLIFILGGSLLLLSYFKKIPSIIPKKQTLLTLLIAAAVVAAPIIIALAAWQIPGQDSLTRRDYLGRAALAMLTDNPVAGVGLNSFTVRLERYSSQREVVRFIQPAHHVGLLWLAETGIAGLLLFAISAWLIFKSKLWPQILLGAAILLPAIVLDHYLLSMHQGILLSIVLMGIIAPNLLRESKRT